MIENYDYNISIIFAKKHTDDISVILFVSAQNLNVDEMAMNRF